MQLTSIEQVKVGMTVWHPIWGEGLIERKDASDGSIRVGFPKIWDKAFWFYDSNNLPSSEVHWISHLYTEPVFICTKVEYKTENEHGMQFNVTHYEPVKPETK